MSKIPYLLEPVLNSELILVNNAKKLKKDPTLLNEKHLSRIEELCNEFIELESLTSGGEKGYQSTKRKVRDEIRDLSSMTYTDRDTNMFGQMITTITQKIVTRPQFSGYTIKDEMQSLAIQHILLYSHGFDPYRQSEITGQFISAFAYISTIVFNACIATINKFNKEQLKAKEDFLEHQKLIHRDPNKSTIGPEFENAERVVHLPSLKQGELYNTIKSTTITQATEFYIPQDYKITEKELNFVLKYEYNISIKRIKPKEPKEPV